MEENKTNYGKIIAITVAVISAASAIAYVIYRLCRSFFTFCDSYREDELADADFDFDEIDEDEIDDDFLILDEEEAESDDAPTEAEEAPAEPTNT
ncbi:MAG: hypothetical protein J6B09_04315 [Clostridia bacterium]|nr:hypothetical protein [Clostridia bacterium]MBQ8716277.1 hypothetical protein [Clostridia bacterium]